jgi:hypothetical protein
MKQRAVLFIAWGTPYVAAVQQCIDESQLPDHQVVVMTDMESDTSSLAPSVRVIRHPFAFPGKERKLEALVALPDEFETVLFLDTDTRVLDDISLGFDQAERHGMALAPAPHYSLADFRTFRVAMEMEGLEPRGQLVYNTGVIFFAADRPEVRALFALAMDLIRKHGRTAWGDQPYVSLAMELLGFNPYTLTPSFNYRGFGELLSGSIRIWHSNSPMPPDANVVDPGYLRRYEDGRLIRVVQVPL